MVKEQFSHVTTWVFDLDNTLYPPSARLFDQIEDLMNAFITEHLAIDLATAHELRARYWREHGTTLAGLMAHHATDPDHFLDVVHDIDLSALEPDPILRDRIKALPGRKLVYTNGSRGHGERVTAARGLSDVLDGIYSVEDAGYEPKPRKIAFDRVFGLACIAPETAAMFEDDPRNLEIPHQLGMRTVLVGEDEPGPHVHHQCQDLSAFLAQIV